MSDRQAGENSAPGPVKPVVFHILLVLMEGERHGYSIVKAVERRTGDEIRIESGNLYRTLRTMLAQGLIEESDRRPDPELDDERRRYFRITELGVRAAEAETARLERMVALARSQKLLAR
jgi:DNA-binding PadR family transcriptional regulator